MELAYSYCTGVFEYARPTRRNQQQLEVSARERGSPGLRSTLVFLSNTPHVIEVALFFVPSGKSQLVACHFFEDSTKSMTRPALPLSCTAAPAGNGHLRGDGTIPAIQRQHRDVFTGLISLDLSGRRHLSSRGARPHVAWNLPGSAPHYIAKEATRSRWQVAESRFQVGFRGPARGKPAPENTSSPRISEVDSCISLDIAAEMVLCEPTRFKMDPTRAPSECSGKKTYDP